MTTGIYKGRRASLSSVKKKVVFAGMTVHVDRPKGFVLQGKDDSGKPWSREYKYDYGFLPKTDGGDSEGVDVYLGPDQSADDAYWVYQLKKDGSFDEYKVFLGFASRADAKKAYKEHGPPFGYGSMVSMRVPLMKAMLGLSPAEKVAADWGHIWRYLGTLR